MKRLSFNDGWTLKREDGTVLPVLLPHDAMQTEPRQAGNPSGPGCGYYKGGVYEYEKHFTPPADWAGKSVIFEFEGAYPTAEVYLNGLRVGGCAYGYEQFLVPGDGLKIGEENVLRVVVDNTQLPNSRWYSGAGLHRPVFVYLGEAEHIEPYGLRISTVSLDPAVVKVTVRHTGLSPARVEILDGDTVVASGTGDELELEVPAARLWSDLTPELYTCRAALPGGDEARESFGVRTLEWGPTGFFVNGRAVKLRGGCVHHDNGILGARSFPESELRRVRILKSAGFNAIRSSHNPASRSLLDACDQVGMYVMDEGWDMWFNHKNPGDYASRFEENWKTDLERMVEKDFNHPCVVMYSIGNEVSEPASRRGLETARALVDTLHALDPSRPVTSGANLVILTEAFYSHRFGGISADKAVDSTEFNKLLSEQFLGMCSYSARPEADAATEAYFALLDIAGYNYASDRYPTDCQKYPDRVVVGSETFPSMLAENWEAVEKYDYLIGDFMWTAWDYLGETGIGAWSCEPDAKVFAKPYPWLLADSGAFDILGHDNAEAGLAMTVWGARDTPYIGIAPPNHPGEPQYRGAWRGSDALPSWSWRGCDGNPAGIEVYSKAPAVALYINGRHVGTAPTKGCRADFSVRYEPGEIRAVALDLNGNELSESALRSARGRLGVRVVPEGVPEAGRPLYVDFSVVGENGEVESNADTVLSVEVTGAELLAFGSAQPRTESRFETGRYETYRGQAQAVLLPNGGPITVKAHSENLGTFEVKL